VSTHLLTDIHLSLGHVQSFHSVSVDRACLVLKAKVDPLAPLALQEIRVNKVKLVKKDRLDLKDVPDRRAPLAHLVPRVTR